MGKIFLFTTFVLGNLTILFLCFLFLTIKTSKQSSALSETPLEIVNLDNQPPALPSLQVLGASTSNEIVAGNSSVLLVENFFKKYRSPMVGQGENIIQAAEKNQIPFTLLPAIGQCEGNLGKTIPEGSFNTWGFGIYGSRITRFSSWEEAINTVSSAIRHNYFDLGLTTPEMIMTKYTPGSNGSWANCVNKFLAELE